MIVSLSERDAATQTEYGALFILSHSMMFAFKELLL
jgi:hypothetical protein